MFCFPKFSIINGATIINHSIIINSYTYRNFNKMPFSIFWVPCIGHLCPHYIIAIKISNNNHYRLFFVCFFISGMKSLKCTGKNINLQFIKIIIVVLHDSIECIFKTTELSSSGAGYKNSMNGL
jgi:hypothetical protein